MASWRKSRIAKLEAFDARCAKDDEASLQYDLDLAFVAANPSIGMLMRRGKPVYYVGLPVYRESKNPRDLIEA